MATSLEAATRATRDVDCDLHGTYSSTQLWRDHWSSCPDCDRMRLEREREERTVEAKRQRILSRLERAGLIGRFADASFASFNAATADQRRAVEVAQQTVVQLETDRWAPLWLLGHCGTGKTHLASAMVRAVITDRDLAAQIWTAKEIISSIRSTWRKGAGSTEEDVIDQLSCVPFLAIDELGVGYGSEAEITQLLDVVDLRYRLQRTVVIASNLGPKELKQAIGDRLHDRLRENATVIPFDWPSHRRAAPAVRHNLITTKEDQ